MKVFADMHHGALSYSLHLLFEKRLGWELFRPIGWDWWKEGYWKYSQLLDTAHSYLDIKDEDIDEGSHFEHYDPDFDYIQKALTLDQFKEMDIGIILCSVGTHETPYLDLRNRLKPEAKLIRQIGNWNEEVDFGKTRNLMISVGPFVCPYDINYIWYHQEFDTKAWDYTEPTKFKTIRTFINCFPDSEDANLWPIYKERLPEFDWKMHGIGGEDGNISPQTKVRETMIDTGFLWHTKLGGEGFGHVIHNAYALGRPCIVKGSYYNGKMAEPLLSDNVTCIDLEKGSINENVERIRHFSKPKNFLKMSKAGYRRFKEVCNLDEEEEALRIFLDRLQ